MALPVVAYWAYDACPRSVLPSAARQVARGARLRPEAGGLEKWGAHMVRWISALILTLSAACTSLDTAPAQLEDLLPWAFAHYESASDGEFAAAIVNLSAAATAVSIDNPLRGELHHRLDYPDINYLHLNDRNPQNAQGLYLLNTFHCTLTQLEKVLKFRDQGYLYPDQYNLYQSNFTSSEADYMARKTSFLYWSTYLSATKGLWTMNETLVGALRFIPDQGATKSPHGAALIARTYMPEPAHFEDADKLWLQDYQVEIYYEQEPGRILHAYGMWRQVDLGAFFHSDSDSFVDNVSSALVDWDKMTESDCAAGKP